MDRMLCCSPNLTAVMGCPWRQAVHRAQFSVSSRCFLFLKQKHTESDEISKTYLGNKPYLFTLKIFGHLILLKRFQLSFSTAYKENRETRVACVRVQGWSNVLSHTYPLTAYIGWLTAVIGVVTWTSHINAYLHCEKTIVLFGKIVARFYFQAAKHFGGLW